MLPSFTPFDASAIEQSIPSRFEQQAQRYADRLAVGGHRELTYAQLNSFANSLARAIQTACPEAGGFRPVAVLLPPGPEALAALLATLKAGKIHVSLDATFPRDRLAAEFADSQARVLLTAPAHRALAESLSAESILMVEIPSSVSPCENLSLDIPPDAPATIRYTSGSTGSPKGVLDVHRGILHNVYSHANASGVGAGDRFLPNRLLGSLNALLNGASVFPYAVKESGLESLSLWLRDNEITVMSAVPTTFRRFAEQLFQEDRFPHLRLIKLTGEAIFPRDVELFLQRFPPDCTLQFSFALTEAGAVTWNRIGQDCRLDGSVVPIGFPIPGKEVLLLDDEGRPVPAGETGEIAVRSRYLAAGYWRRPDLTEARFLKDPGHPDVRLYLTGDLGRASSNGMLIHLGRKDSQVKIRANRVELAEVEAALQSVEGVRQAAVVARQDSSGETSLAAYFVPSKTPPPPFGLVRRALAQKLPGYMVPATVTPLEQFPLLPNGKIDRRALPDPLRPERKSGSFNPPRSPMELLLAASWREVLRIEQVGLSDNFFELGGDSLAAIELATVVEQKTGVRISPVSMASQTLAQLAALIEERAPAARSPWLAQCAKLSGAGRGSPAMEPFFFGPSDRQLFGVFHPPSGGPARDWGVVLCQPLEHEFYNAHRCLRQLAQALSDDGLAVLRFDYFGTGDSAGAWEETSLAQWLDDIDCAIAEMRWRGCARVCLAGLRFGATLAALFSAERRRVDALVLWEPVASGEAYLRELEVFHQTQTAGTAAARPGAKPELLGFEYSGQMRREIGRVDLRVTSQGLGCDVLLIEGAGRANDGLRATLQGTARHLDHFETPPVQHFWFYYPDRSLLPGQIPRSVLSWMANLCR